MEYKLPKEFTKKWLKALRSGEFEQSQSSLCHEEKYCCLGVAAKIYGVDMGAYGLYGYLEPHMSDALPKEFFEINKTEYSDDYLLQDSLIKLNDSEELSFPEIADWIEKNIELY